MLTIVIIYILISLAAVIISILADLTESKIGFKSWYRQKRSNSKTLQAIDRLSPLHPLRWTMRKVLRFRRTSITISVLLLFHFGLHIVNPYASPNLFKSPYETKVEADGSISYNQVYKPAVLSDSLSDLLGYYRSGFLIVQNTFFGGAPIEKDTSKEIIEEIHDRRFDPSKPYLISGDQFSVLYPRNLGVFYNQLLDPNTAHSKEDWENRQRIYLQSVLFAIDGLSAGDKPKTTLVPVAPRTIAATTVHPGDYGSDAVYGLLYALDKLSQESTSSDGKYSIQTQKAAQQILAERESDLKKIVRNYIKHVQDPWTKMVRTDIHLSSARDGASRTGSFYDNIVFWKTLKIADELGIRQTSQTTLNQLHNNIKYTYWNDKKGYYKNDIKDNSFSSDWLLAYVIGFLDLSNPEDLERTERTIAYINANGLADPLPIKYQIGNPAEAPLVIKAFVPNYGGETIWSYWGAEYITLLVNLASVTSNEEYLSQARSDIDGYNQSIVRDGGFAETFNTDGQFLQSGVYKSIRVTGWVVQFEHAMDRYKRVRSEFDSLENQPN